MWPWRRSSFENGALGVIEASTAAYPGYLKKIELHGSHGTAVMEEEDIVTWDFAKAHRRDVAIKKKMAESRAPAVVQAIRRRSAIMVTPSSFAI